MTVKNSDKMATWPISKLLFSMGLPAVFSMLIQALYNYVDSIYISHYSKDALFAIGLATPLQTIGFSIAIGGAIGISTLIARKLGEQDEKEADYVASTGIILSFLHYLIIFLIGLSAVPFLSLFTNRGEIIDLGQQYLKICLCFSFGQVYSLLFGRILQSQGNMLIPMLGQLIGALTNIVLDPILIFGYFGFPILGVRGAAIATVIGQIFSAIFNAWFAIKGKHDVHFVFKGLRFDRLRLKAIYIIAIPTALMNMISSLTTTLLNGILVSFGEDAVNALSIYFKLQSFVFMPIFGFNQGALPILSYNYGAQNAQRYKETIVLFLKTAIIFMIFGTFLFYCMPDLLLTSFKVDDHLRIIAEEALRNISLSFIPAAISIVLSTLFQSFGRGFISMLQSLLRQIGFLVPLAYLFANFGLYYVWYAYPVAEILVIFIFIPLAKRTYRYAFENI